RTALRASVGSIGAIPRIHGHIPLPRLLREFVRCQAVWLYAPASVSLVQPRKWLRCYGRSFLRVCEQVPPAQLHSRSHFSHSVAAVAIPPTGDAASNSDRVHPRLIEIWV